MKKKLKIDLLYKGQENENLTTIIAQNNAGVNPVSLDDIASYLWVRRSLFEMYCNPTKDEPFLKNVHAMFEEDDKTKLLIMEKGKCVAVIEEVEIYELSENPVL